MDSSEIQERKRRKIHQEVPRAVFPEATEERYAEQLAGKRERVDTLFKDMSIPDIEVHRSKSEHYRLRTEFRVWQDKDDIFYVMFDKRKEGARKDGSKVWDKQRVDSFPVVSEAINRLMAEVIEGVRDVKALRHKLFQAAFHVTLSGEAMVTLAYHSKMEEDWMEAARLLHARLNNLPHAQGSSIGLIGRAKNQKITLDRDFVLEKFEVDGKTFVYKQVEGTFSQPNGEVCGKMLTWARDVTRGSKQGDLLELYCGNGNFTIALADNFREVIATEVSKASVGAAIYNIEMNGTNNVHVARLSSEEFVEAWRGDREFFRMRELPPVKGRVFQTLLVDPPRSGLDDRSVELLQHFENVLYISCNPTTLHANILQMNGSHTIQRFAIFDQFPYTDHIECGVYLTRKQPLK